LPAVPLLGRSAATADAPIKHRSRRDNFAG
jgi:hypothetical protein